MRRYFGIANYFVARGMQMVAAGGHIFEKTQRVENPAHLYVTEETS